MAMELIYLAVATMLVPALAEIAKMTARMKKSLEYMAAGAVLFVIGATFEVLGSISALSAYASVMQYVTVIAGIIGMIFVLVGGIKIVLNLMK